MFIESIFGLTLDGPYDDNFVTPTSIFNSIVKATKVRVPAPVPPPFKFDMTEKAITRNTNELKKYNIDVVALLNKN